MRAGEVDFCLEPLTVMDRPAEEGVRIAAASGCRFASLWVQRPGVDWPIQCLVETTEMAKRIGAVLAGEGVAPLNLEVFELTRRTAVSSYRPALEIGALLGAQGATAIFRDEAEPQDRLELLVEFAQLAAAFNLRANVEFISYLGVRTLRETLGLLAQAGQPNLGVVIDLLHHVRSGGSVDDIRAMDRSLIGHAQICDGPATVSAEVQRREGGADRMIPGQGDFPVRAFIEALPPMPVGLEAPFGSSAFLGLTPLERVRRFVEASRQALTGGET